MTKEELIKLRTEWERRICDFKASGQSQSLWCREKGINLRTFNYWYLKLKHSTDTVEKSPNWISMKIEKSFDQEEKQAINIKIGNAIIETNSRFDPEHLLKIIRTINSLC
jgi:hypothetical protein